MPPFCASLAQKAYNNHGKGAILLMEWMAKLIRHGAVPTRGFNKGGGYRPIRTSAIHSSVRPCRTARSRTPMYSIISARYAMRTTQ